MTKKEAKQQALDCIITNMRDYVSSGLLVDSWMDAQNIQDESTINKVETEIENILKQLETKLEKLIS